MKSFIRFVCLLLLSTCLHAQAVELSDTNTSIAKIDYPVDAKSGLIKASGWELVNGQCNACHSSLIVPQNHGDRDFWRETIQWMVDTQGLWDLSDTWEPTLDYLSTYYNQVDIDMTLFRRKPIDKDSLPPSQKADIGTVIKRDE